MNINRSHRSKRRRIQEQLFAYTTNTGTNINIFDDMDVDNQNASFESQTNFEVITEVSNSHSKFTPVLSSIETTNEPQIGSSNQIPFDVQNIPQINTDGSDSEIDNFSDNCFPLDNVSTMCSILHIGL